ncbi:MAG: dipeptidase [Bacilli bacterium]
MKIFDAHGDLFTHFFSGQKLKETAIFKNHHYDNFKNGNVGFGVFNFWIEDSKNKTTQDIVDMFSYAIKEVIQNKYLKPVYKFSDFDLSDNRVQFLIGLEGIDYLNSANDLYMMYQFGVRLVSLTWNGGNKFASSNTCEIDNGLSKEGIEAIKVMNNLGVINDISHLSDKSAMQILELSSKPVVASHSNVRNIVNHPRNLTDELIKKVAKTNGVIGLNSFVKFIADDKDNYNIEHMISHMNYIKDLVGVDHICFGFDFMDYLTPYSPFVEDIVYIENFKNHGDMNNLINAMVSNGYTQDEIEKIAYKNFFRVIKEVL